MVEEKETMKTRSFSVLQVLASSHLFGCFLLSLNQSTSRVMSLNTENLQMLHKL